MTTSDATASSLARITAARILLFREAPFFGSLTARLRPFPVSDDEIETIGVMADGRLPYSPAFVMSLSLRELAGALAHEVMHLAGDVFGRRGERQPLLWNMAHDYAINPLVVEAGLPLPAGALLRKDWVDLPAEVIYERLKSAITEFVVLRKCDACGGSGEVDGHDCDACAGTGRQISPGFGLPGRGCADHSHPDNRETGDGSGPRMSVWEWRAAVAEAAEAARSAGRMTAGLNRWVGRLLHPVLDWRDVLSRTAQRALGPAVPSWRRPLRRSWAAGVYLPGWVREGRDATVALDTSGSISQPLLTRFASEVEAIIRTAGGRVTILCCDADVTEVADAESVHDVGIRGGGGTSFVPVFQYLADVRRPHTQLLVYFTDLEGEFPVERPSFPVVWCVPRSASLHAEPPPFGSVLALPNDD